MNGSAQMGEEVAKVLVDNKFEIGSWSPAIVCCRVMEKCLRR